MPPRRACSRPRLAATAALAALAALGCGMRGGPILVSPELQPAQNGLAAFARAMGTWDLAALDRLIVGGADNPAWKLRKAAFEGRGVRVADVQVGPVRSLTTRIAIGPIRFRLTGLGGLGDKRVLVSRVLLIRMPGGWQVSYWGTRSAVKRHLAWIAGGGDPLKDPFFTKLVEHHRAQQERLQPPGPKTP